MGRSLTHYLLGQNRLDLGKINLIYCQLSFTYSLLPTEWHKGVRELGVVISS